MPEPVLTDNTPYAWLVYVEGRESDYLVFHERQDAVDECLHQIENSDPPVDSWDLWPLYQAQADQITFD